MAGNSSSSFSIIPLLHCADKASGQFLVLAFMLTKFFLVLPFYIFVLYLGHRRWWQQRSFATSSHCDIFSYHMAVLEVIYALATALICCGLYTGVSWMMIGPYYICCIVIPGQTCFHILTCVKHYLAVVHPITYLGLKQSRGVRIRNISIVCVWLQCFGWIGVTAWYSPSVPYIPYFCMLVLGLVIISFCNLSVLCVLVRPGPGEIGGAGAQVDQSKQRAFHTITAIMVALCLFFLVFLVCLALENSRVLSYSDGCLVLMASNWASLPCSLASPLLFLHRAGKLPCCHGNSEER